MSSSMDKQYVPAAHEARIRARWDQAVPGGIGRADPSRVDRSARPTHEPGAKRPPFAIFIPPPNVTGQLHLGHALNNTLQDILTRTHRMMGFETLWMPGTDHAGIATQAVVEKRLLKEENKRRKDFTREQFIARVQTWKDEYEARITEQLKAMGCSCDFSRQRFTMDDICARAVREAFFRLFKDGLIYRGKRLVNWDPALQTAVADDECYEEECETAFYYLRYPLVRVRNGQGPNGQMAKEDSVPVTWGELTARGYPGSGEHPGDQQAWVTVATTRPETYLGDTAVAISQHDPRAAALRGLLVQLPIIGRVIPIIEDTSGYVVLPKAYARSDEERDDPKAEFATGFLKVTPAHDNNDYQLGQLYAEQIKANSAGEVMINILSPEGRLSDQHGWSDIGDARRFVGLKAMQTHDGIRQPAEARKAVVEALKGHPIGSDAYPVLEKVRPYRQTLKFSDRSKALIEPYLSDQWFCKVTDDRMAGAANRALALGGTALQSRVLDDSPTEADSALTDRLKLSHRVLAAPALHVQGFVGMDPYPQGQRSSSHLYSYRRNLPHVTLPGATYFVTWVFEGSPSLSAAERTGVLNALRHFDGQTIRLLAACVMPDHVHVLVAPLGSESLDNWIGSVKKFSSRQINSARGGKGALWQDESFDHIVRNARWLGRFVEYIRANPVEAGLAPDPESYEWTWLSDTVHAALGGAVAKGTVAEDTALESRATKSDHTLHFYPSRYAKTYEQWHAGIRDWCISRQLWWGHRIPVWHRRVVIAPRTPGNDNILFDDALEGMTDQHGRELATAQIRRAGTGELVNPRDPAEGKRIYEQGGEFDVYVCTSDPSAFSAKFDLVGFAQDPDVLDTWFSSALWPLSTLGWPDPNQSPDTNGLLGAFNPSSLLSTAREIITLWVSRMVMMNRYLLGEGRGNGPVPFKDVFIHAVVQDGDGKRMSKSAGNGVDPLDIIASHGADAMRFTLCQMTTSTQDVRMPVMKDSKTGKNTSPKFDLGRNVCNKLWNAARFAMTMLEGGPALQSRNGAQISDRVELQSQDAALESRATTMRLAPMSLSPVDRWMLSRLAQASEAITEAIKGYEFSAYAQTLYDLLWRDFCDWYLEAIKPTVQSDPGTRATLVHTLEAILRLAHPLLPYVSEAIYEHVRTLSAAPITGIDFGRRMPEGTPLALMPWPVISGSLRDAQAEREFGALQELAGIIREARSQHKVEPKRKIVLHADQAALAPLGGAAAFLPIFAGLQEVKSAPPATGEGVKITMGAATLTLTSLADALDAGAERERLAKQVADLEKSVGALKGRLDNPSYATKAPPHLVEQSKAELASKQAELAAARRALEAL